MTDVRLNDVCQKSPTRRSHQRDRRRGPPGGLWYHPASRQAFIRALACLKRPHDHDRRGSPLAKTPRTWTGARTPSGLKRVRQANRRHEVLGPRRSAAKTYVARAVDLVSASTDMETATVALTEALSALDRAAKAGAIHPNAAARRKSRLTRKVNAAVGGVAVGGPGRVAKTTGKAAAAKAAKARIAAGKSTKAKGAQTAAGKARAALSKTARAEAAAAKEAQTGTAERATPAKPARPAAKAATAKTAAKTTKSAASKSTSKTAPRKTTPKA